MKTFHHQRSLLLVGVFLLLSWSSSDLAVVSAETTTTSTPTTTIEGRLQFPDKSAFNITTQVTLNHQDFITYTRTDGTFSIYNVPPGVHQLDVQSTTHHFSQVKIQLLPETMSDAPKCNEYAFPGANKQVMECALKNADGNTNITFVTLTTVAMYDYFEKRSGFSIFSLFKNPMVLMMAFSVLIMYFMPTMMEGLDPEEKARMKKQMEMQQDPSKMFSSFMEGLTGQPEETAAAAPKSNKARKIKK